MLSDDSSPDTKSDDSSHDEDAEEFADSPQGTSSKKIQGLRSGEPLQFNFQAYEEKIQSLELLDLESHILQIQ